jgi:hypothetical protein
MQGGEADRRLVTGFFDQAPSRIAVANTQKIRRITRLAWGDTLNLFGGTRYTVLLDGQPIAETTQSEYALQPGQMSDGHHRVQIAITDRRGQRVVSRTRRLRVDNTPPTVRFGLTRKKRVLTVTVKGGDPDGRLRSGLSRILVDFGDGKLIRVKRKISKRYAESGTYTIRIKALDKAGNETVESREVRITNK